VRPADRENTELGLRSIAPAGEVRGVRPYVAGDQRRNVHWAASAHRNALMVRELEQPRQGAARIEVILPDDGPAGDEVAARALGSLLEMLRQSGPVVLTTTERSGKRSDMVSGPADAGRRLARAVAPR
jgi:uncharacterized protein (DUF58 family)